MADGDEGNGVSVSLCVQKLDRIIGELANRHGAASVAAALTEIVGCSWCARDEASRGRSIRVLMTRIGVDKGTTMG
jgi:hypothetical protein